MMIFDFRKKDKQIRWVSVNDGVMGGLSSSRFEMTEEGFATFSGDVSLEYGGGFASVKTLPNSFDLSSCSGLSLRVRGDGKSYSFRIRTSEDTNREAYEAIFETSKDEWMEVELPFEYFKAVFRGRVLDDAPPLNISQIVQFGFMIKEKQEGAFRLDIEWIGALKNVKK